MFTEDELLPISGLQHLAYCERQWALIHLEQQWVENRLTAEGRQLHERADQPAAESRGGVRIARGLLLRSLRLGLYGRADVVEFRAPPETDRGPASSVSPPDAGTMPALPGAVFPVEYKRGRPKPGRCDEVQLCAQALCLEEMLRVPVPAGAIFYGTPRRRLEVAFVPALRAETEALAARMHALYRTGRTPPPVYGPKCENCSLAAICLPREMGRKASRYLRASVAASGDDG